jgi:hypothetical protein
MYCLLSSVLFPLYHEANPPQESLDVLPSIDAKVVRVHPEDNGLFAILPGGSPSLGGISSRVNVEVGSEQFLDQGQQLDP